MERRLAVVLASRQGDVLRGEVILRLRTRQREPLQRFADILEAAVARVQPSYRLVGHVHVVCLGCECVYYGVYRFTFAAQVFFAMGY